MRPWGITHPGGRQNGAAELTTKPWWHTDQRPSKRGLHCIQGFLTLTPVGHDAGALCEPQLRAAHPNNSYAASPNRRFAISNCSSNTAYVHSVTPCVKHVIPAMTLVHV